MAGQKGADSRWLAILQIKQELPVFNVGFKLMALQLGSKTLQSGLIAGSGSVARGQELLVGGQRKGNGRAQKEVDEDEEDCAAELHDKLGFL